MCGGDGFPVKVTLDSDDSDCGWTKRTLDIVCVTFESDIAQSSVLGRVFGYLDLCSGYCDCCFDWNTHAAGVRGESRFESRAETRQVGGDRTSSPDGSLG